MSDNPRSIGKPKNLPTFFEGVQKARTGQNPTEPAQVKLGYNRSTGFYITQQKNPKGPELKAALDQLLKLVGKSKDIGEKKGEARIYINNLKNSNALMSMDSLNYFRFQVLPPLVATKNKNGTKLKFQKSSSQSPPKSNPAQGMRNAREMPLVHLPSLVWGTSPASTP